MVKCKKEWNAEGGGRPLKLIGAKKEKAVDVTNPFFQQPTEKRKHKKSQNSNTV